MKPTENTDEMIAKKTTIRDVSQAAGVSISTVSRVLNNREKAKTVPPEIREQVMKCAGDLNYVPNANVRRVFTRRAGIIGLVVPSFFKMKMHIFEDGHLRRLISGIEAGIETSDYRLLLIFNDDRFIAKKEYLSLIQSQNVDGLIVWGAQPGEDYWNEPVEAGLPVIFAVTIPGVPSGFNYVVNANRIAVRTALDELVAKGHRKILYVNQKSPQFLLAELDAGVEKYREEHPEVTIETFSIPEFEFDLISPKQFSVEDSPTAILAYNYAKAEGIFHVLVKEGLRIPEDAEMIACYSFTSRKNWISTMLVDDFEIGKETVLGLLQLIDEPSRKIQMVVPSKYSPGKTTR